MGISISFLMEKRNANKYKEELKNQSLQRIIKNTEVDLNDFDFNYNVNKSASKAINWLVENNDNLLNISNDSVGFYLNNAVLLNTIFVDNQEEYRALQNSGLIELIENEKVVTYLQNKYIYHEFYKKIEAEIMTEGRALSDFLYENTVLKDEKRDDYGYYYNRVSKLKNTIPNEVLERLKNKKGLHDYYVNAIKNRIINDSLLIDYLNTEAITQ
jgi:hypothetical protein